MVHRVVSQRLHYHTADTYFDDSKVVRHFIELSGPRRILAIALQQLEILVSDQNVRRADLTALFAPASDADLADIKGYRLQTTPRQTRKLLAIVALRTFEPDAPSAWRSAIPDPVDRHHCCWFQPASGEPSALSEKFLAGTQQPRQRFNCSSR